jgi:hypothetical protein
MKVNGWYPDDYPIYPLYPDGDPSGSTPYPPFWEANPEPYPPNPEGNPS